MNNTMFAHWEAMSKCGAEKTWNWLGVRGRLSVVYSITQQQTEAGRYHRHSCPLVKGKLCCTSNLGHSNCLFMYLPPTSSVYLIIFQVEPEKWRAPEWSKCRRGKTLSPAMIWAFYTSQTFMLRPNCPYHRNKGGDFRRWSSQRGIALLKGMSDLKRVV